MTILLSASAGCSLSTRERCQATAHASDLLSVIYTTKYIVMKSGLPDERMRSLC